MPVLSNAIERVVVTRFDCEFDPGVEHFLPADSIVVRSRAGVKSPFADVSP